MSLRVDLEVASQDLRVGVRVKASTLEKALLPTGTVRLLEFYFRGSVSVRAETRDEFPFVSTVSGSTPRDIYSGATSAAARLRDLRPKATEASPRSSLEYHQSHGCWGATYSTLRGFVSSAGTVRCGTSAHAFLPSLLPLPLPSMPREQAFVAFDYPPQVQLKLEQWGLDTLTLGAVPAAVDEWARIALQQALAPYVLPG